jgi:hypothetical protein
MTTKIKHQEVEADPPAAEIHVFRHDARSNVRQPVDVTNVAQSDFMEGVTHYLEQRNYVRIPDTVAGVESYESSTAPEPFISIVHTRSGRTLAVTMPDVASWAAFMAKHATSAPLLDNLLLPEAKPAPSNMRTESTLASNIPALRHTRGY